MPKRCEFCGKGPVKGRVYSRRGTPKKKGGVGIKVTRVNPRRFLPNLQRMKVLLAGRLQRVLVCTKCLKSGRLTRPPFPAST